ncbi:MAG: aldehyde dehydrogenase [Prolixibacteraceae bacterium]|jgi:aldehyde dehydrogenase (NAD+)|nr:aldehyde dehydrogenase [Prolixibacteraceae bacterium]
MQYEEVILIIEQQRRFFASGKTLDVRFRLEALKKLKNAVLKNEQALQDALKNDLGKSHFESYATEIGVAIKELNFHLRKLKRWTRPQSRPTPLALFPSRSKVYFEPFGNVLIMAPWNYPFLLLVQPLIGAISAGNTVLLKASSYVPEYEKAIGRLIAETFPPEYVALVSGGREINQLLFQQKFDYLFFTGSPQLGKLAMKAAAVHLCPVTLELGGKSPCVVTGTADLKCAARRIVWGKFLNAGQTCVAPDYLLVHSSVKDPFLSLLKMEIGKQFGADPKASPDFPRIVNENAFDRLSGLLKQGRIVVGGETDRSLKYIAPTIIDEVQTDFEVMQDEIFGPILPVLTFETVDDAVGFISGKEKPLAMYIFSSERKEITQLLQGTSAGGGCINDVIMHVANSNIPFGGVGNSGMGKYHGKHSFDTFSNQRAIISTTTLIDPPVRYAPYSNWKMRLVKMLLR